jgi:hypothetical protein
MSNLESSVFTSIIPLVANGFFSPPRWDDVLQYSFVDVNLVADTNCSITVLQSPDRQNISSSSVLTTTANTPYTTVIPIYARYIQLQVNNLQAVAQTKFSLQTIYKQVSTVAAAGSANANIFDSSGNIISATSGALNANLYTSSGIAITTSSIGGSYALDVADLNLATCISAGSVSTINPNLNNCIANNQLLISLENINTNYIDAGIGGLKVAVENTSLTVSDAALDGCISSGSVSVLVSNTSLTVSEPSLDACIASNQVAVNVANSSPIAVSESSLDGCIANNQVSVNVANSSAILVSEQTLDACIASNQVAVNVANSTPINVSNIIPDTQNIQRVVVSNGNNISGSVSGAHKLVNIVISSNDNGASASYLKLYDSTSPILGTDTPISVITLGNYNFGGVIGINFSNGIGYGISGGIADNDTSGANSDISITLIYI